MPIDDVVNITVSLSAAGPTREGFGEPLIAAYTSVFSGRTMEFSSLSEMISAGFSATDPAYLAATKVKSQTPSPPKFKVGRRGLSYTQTLKLTALSTSATDTYAFSVGGKAVSVASTGVPATDAATLATAVTALSISGLTATHTSTNSFFTITMTAGKLVDVVMDTAHLALVDQTADPGIATDLAAILVADSDWYGLCLDSNSPAEVGAAMAWCEANGKLGAFNCSDTAIADPASTTDIAYTSKAAAYARSFGLFSQSQLLSYSAAAWLGRNLPLTPGSENWAFKTLAGVTADRLSGGQVHAVENKNWSVYTPLLGVNCTQFGKTPSGEWIDITRFSDWVKNEMQVQILGLLLNNNKIPFTDAGIDTIRATMLGVLHTGVDVGGLASSPAPTVSLPAASSVDSVNKANRNVPNVSAGGTLAGAINSLQLGISLTA